MSEYCFISTQSILHNIIDTASGISWLQWVSFISGIAYVVLAAQENKWCWVWGNISCAILAWLSYHDFLLYADALLQLIYVAMGFWGLYQWTSGTTHTAKRIASWHWTRHLLVIAIGIFISYPLGFALQHYTIAAATYLDAFTMVFSLVATWLTLNKILENWLYWMVINLIYIYLYTIRDGYLFAILSLIYLIISVKGYYDWKRTFLTKKSISH